MALKEFIHPWNAQHHEHHQFLETHLGFQGRLFPCQTLDQADFAGVVVSVVGVVRAAIVILLALGVISCPSRGSSGMGGSGGGGGGGGGGGEGFEKVEVEIGGGEGARLGELEHSRRLTFNEIHGQFRQKRTP